MFVRPKSMVRPPTPPLTAQKGPRTPPCTPPRTPPLTAQKGPRTPPRTPPLEAHTVVPEVPRLSLKARYFCCFRHF